ncbi:hypothetical protein HanXRQr2_Chr08g0350841 [Helianthus annuus]|uniref:Uncharacterized protein n=1 Tax=Helianthus annuus TaxID=4232 RepID=A0A9K3NDG4_HELAN|nr:hypothetical protein HanXRQr2_Chr08g0350841 [Helianthus annuus]KAJ0902598.1 hypothetical protein HanPSC8_Chr08g0338881 [Helianthus annuus]
MEKMIYILGIRLEIRILLLESYIRQGIRQKISRRQFWLGVSCDQERRKKRLV